MVPQAIGYFKRMINADINKKFGAIALIGATNAGKSTLTNAMVGEKVAIVSRKVQTTRFQIRGILTHNNAQIVIVDTPGFFKPRRKFDRSMIATAWDAVEELQAEASHQKQKGAAKSSFDKYCDENPEADECRVYDN